MLKPRYKVISVSIPTNIDISDLAEGFRASGILLDDTGTICTQYAHVVRLVDMWVPINSGIGKTIDEHIGHFVGEKH